MALQGPQGYHDFQWVTGNNPALTVVRKLGCGGYGKVYEVRDLNASDAVSRPAVFARKIVLPIAGISYEDAQRELENVREIRNRPVCQNIPQFFEWGWLHYPGSQIVFAYADMELCDFSLHDFIYEGASAPPSVEMKAFLRDLLRIRFKGTHLWLSQDTAYLCYGLEVMRQITSGLDYLHSNGIQHSQGNPDDGFVHRDLKPSNVMFSFRDANWKIIDFGLALTGGSAQNYPTYPGPGTKFFRAPELMDGYPTWNRKVDIWALGCIFFEIAFRRRAFRRDPNREDARQFITQLNLQSQELNMELRSKRILLLLIYAMLHPTPSERPPTRAILEALSVLQRDDKIDVRLLGCRHNRRHSSSSWLPWRSLDSSSEVNYNSSPVYLSLLPEDELWTMVGWRWHCSKCMQERGLDIDANFGDCNDPGRGRPHKAYLRWSYVILDDVRDCLRGQAKECKQMEDVILSPQFYCNSLLLFQELLNNGNLPRFMETISQLVNGHISRENMLNVVQRYLYLGPQSPWFGFLRSISEAWRYN